ncbi:hypothetical protein L195_g052700, partial [Trifolium pratense]
RRRLAVLGLSVRTFDESGCVPCICSWFVEKVRLGWVYLVEVELFTRREGSSGGIVRFEIMVFSDNLKLDGKFDDVAGILPGKEIGAIKVRVLRL